MSKINDPLSGTKKFLKGGGRNSDRNLRIFESKEDVKIEEQLLSDWFETDKKVKHKFYKQDRAQPEVIHETIDPKKEQEKIVFDKLKKSKDQEDKKLKKRRLETVGKIFDQEKKKAEPTFKVERRKLDPADRTNRQPFESVRKRQKRLNEENKK